MIITCKECSTSFKLDDSLVKESGAKCRCSVCKHIFTAYPLPMEKDQEPEKSSDLEIEESTLDQDDSEPDEEASDVEESDFETGVTGLDVGDSDLEMDNDDFKFESSDLEDDEDGLEFESPDLEDDEDNFEFESSNLKMDDTDSEKEDSDFEMDDDFSFEDSEFEMDDDDTSQETGKEDTLNFEYDDLEFEADTEEADTEEADTEEVAFQSVEDDELFTEEEESESAIEMDEEANENPDVVSIIEDDEFELEFDDEDDTDIEDIVGKEENLSLEVESDEDDPVISYGEEKIENGEQEPSVITPEDDFSEYDEVLEQETEPGYDDSLEEETIETLEDYSKKEDINAPQEEVQPVLTPTPSSRIKKKKSGIGTPILLLLLIFLLVAGAYIASIMTGFKIPYISNIQIPFIEQYLKKPASEISDVKPVPNQKSVNGRFVTNAAAGTLFVITGRVDNPSNVAYSHIYIQGTLITKGKEEAKTKKAYCGNIIPEDMLKTGNIADIDKILAVKTGNNNLNANINPKTDIPFMIVFSDLPEQLQNFTVKVISFEKVKTN